MRERQDEYYKVLGECDHRSDSGLFVEFLLEAIYDVLNDVLNTGQVTQRDTEQVERLLNAIGDHAYSTKELMEF